MAESAEELHARVTAVADQNGRLPAPSVAEWDVFPWEVVEGELVPKKLAAPGVEKPRMGENGVGCAICAEDPPGVIGTNGRWRLKHLAERGGMVVSINE